MTVYRDIPTTPTPPTPQVIPYLAGGYRDPGNPRGSTNTAEGMTVDQYAKFRGIRTDLAQQILDQAVTDGKVETI